jgi:hypothetical protein
VGSKGQLSARKPPGFADNAGGRGWSVARSQPLTPQVAETDIVAGGQAFGLDQGDAEPAGAPSWVLLVDLEPSAPEIKSRRARLSWKTCWG